MKDVLRDWLIIDTLITILITIGLVMTLFVLGDLAYNHYTKPNNGDMVTIEYTQHDGTIKNVSGVVRAFERDVIEGKPFNIVVCDTVQSDGCIVISSFNGDVILSVEKETE